MGLKNLLTSFLLLTSVWCFGQKQTALDIVMRHLEENHSKYNLISSDIESTVVSDMYQNALTGGTYIYLNQSYDGVKIKNALMNFAVTRDGKIAHVGNKFIPQLASKVQKSKASLNPAKAIVSAAEHLGIIDPEKPRLLRRTESDIYYYAKTDYTDQNILVELVYTVVNDKVVLSYQATMDMRKTADYWEIRMDATNGTFLSKNNLTVYCNHEHGKFAKHTNCGAHTKVIKEVSAPTTEEMVQISGSYRVYPLPAESPNHGAHTLVVNPHIQASSPFGWHDVNGVDGPEFTITRGNNVYAYTDKDNDNSPDADVAQPDGGANLVFDFPHNRDLNPILNPNSAQTNLFYMVNMMHDLTTLYGFDESAGNFQQRNYTGQGNGNDYVLAQAFDGFEAEPPSLNNANFATPSDGNNGVMQMFLWDAASGAVSVDAPSDIAAFYEYGTANFGPPVPAVTADPITGPVELVTDGTLQNPTTGCTAIENDLTGKIALIDRGLCFFSEKSYNAQTKGAIGVIICNIAGVSGGDGETTFGMTGSTNADLVNVPTVSFKKSDCEKIKVALSNNVEVVVTMHERENTGPDFYDGAFDNGIIAHEFGHGVSNRLTGGPSQAGCLGNDEQMGEGWSDYFSLVTSVEVGDVGTNSRGIGTYAVSEPIDGRGIRRFPYSTDMNINPQTYDDIKGTGTAPHPLGEVWVDCLWDLYWKFVDLYGFDANYANLQSGNAKAIQLAIEGMRIQPCNPGFIEGRDAIIAADEILFEGEHNCLIWDVFARRGVGYFADGGSTDDRNDGTEDFESRPTCLEALKLRKTASPFLNAGDDILIKLVATNHIPQQMKAVVVTDELPDGTTFVAGSSNIPGTVNGNVLTFALGDMDYEDEVVVTYKVKTSTALKSSTLSFYNFDENTDGWEVLIDEGLSTWTESVDYFTSPFTSFGIMEEGAGNDHSLVSPTLKVTGAKTALKFMHRFETQGGIDGGFIQVSQDGGLTWRFTKRENFIRNGYSSAIDYGTLAIPSLEGFTGSSGEVFIDSYLDLTPYQGKDIKVRFRYGSDEMGTSASASGGWWVDDVELVDLFTYKAEACISEQTGQHGACAIPTETIINSDGSVNANEVDLDFYEVVITPNPASQYFRVKASAKSNELAKLTVTTIEGKTVYNAMMALSNEESIHTVSTTGMPSGMYIVTLQSGQHYNTQKVVVH